MKINPISHSFQNCSRNRKGDIRKIAKNTDSSLHPFSTQREYKRALNTVKIERLLAKPFVRDFPGHTDAIQRIIRNPDDISLFASASTNGDLFVWNIQTGSRILSERIENSFIKDITFVPNEQNLISCSTDRKIKIWSYDTKKLVKEYNFSEGLLSVDHHRERDLFLTSGDSLCLWSSTSKDPIWQDNWGLLSYNYSAFNPTEKDLFAVSSTRGSLVLGDSRSRSFAANWKLYSRSNTLSWNQMRPMYLCSACDDGNSYVYDIRSTKKPIYALYDHTAAVMSCDYSPTGEEIVTGGYDRTIRIYETGNGRSRDVYHTSRMDRVISTVFTGDSKYILSASDDSNIRLWKSNASETSSLKSNYEKDSLRYKQKLKDKFMPFPEIHRIASHKHLPKKVRRDGKKIVAARKREEVKRNSK